MNGINPKILRTLVIDAIRSQPDEIRHAVQDDVQLLGVEVVVDDDNHPDHYLIRVNGRPAEPLVVVARSILDALPDEAAVSEEGISHPDNWEPDHRRGR